MSTLKQLDFNLQFVKDAMNQWKEAANNYEKEAEKAYSRMRSYLTLYQFRLSDDEKYTIREMLSQNLDSIDKADLVDDMDNYLDGFCFKLDKSVIPSFKEPKRIPTSVQIQIAPEPTQVPSNEQLLQPSLIQQPDTNTEEPELFPAISPINYNETALDYNDFDFYTMQFLQ